MKAISDLVFELKLPKPPKGVAPAILEAHKQGKIYILKEIPEQGRIEMGNIAGFVKSVIFLNNKVIVRIKFETRNCIKEAKYQFVKLPFDGYVLLPADDLLSKDLAVHAEKCKAAIQ